MSGIPRGAWTNLFFGAGLLQAKGDDTVLTKFSRQAADLEAVYLYKEGLFVRAYNEGAYGFIHQVLVCKPIRRFVKSVGADRVVCGVPLTVLTALPGFSQKAVRLDDLSWRWPLAHLIDGAHYALWRDSLPLFQANTAETTPAPVNQAQRLVDRLMQFNLAASTPRAALNLVADLQQQWQNRSQEREVA